MLYLISVTSVGNNVEFLLFLKIQRNVSFSRREQSLRFTENFVSLCRRLSAVRVIVWVDVCVKEREISDEVTDCLYHLT